MAGEPGVPLLVKTGYGVVEIGTNTLIVFASFYFLFYTTEALGVPPLYAGLLFFCAKMFDVITDPLIGNFSDRSNTPMGRRRPFMLAGGIALGPCVALMFLAPFFGVRQLGAFGALFCWLHHGDLPCTDPDLCTRGGP